MNTRRQVAGRLLLLVLECGGPTTTGEKFSASRNVVQLAPDACTTCQVALQAITTYLLDSGALAGCMTHSLTCLNARDRS